MTIKMSKAETIYLNVSYVQFNANNALNFEFEFKSNQQINRSFKMQSYQSQHFNIYRYTS